MADLVDRIRRAAAADGFLECRIAPAVDASGFTDLVRWIDAGYAGTMDYIANRIDAYRHPSGVLPGSRSIIALTYPYPAHRVVSCSPGHGRTARYVDLERDYHDLIHPKLKRLCGILCEARPGVRARGVVDTAPLLEREFAVLAGLGWRGKNTLLLNRSSGSYFLLACVLVDIDLPADVPQTTDHCGTCTACLDACPTDAFVSPGVLDASRCISYLTIENRGMPAPEIRPAMGDWWFGCDVCQEVCPWNRKPTRSQDTDSPAVDLIELFSLDEAGFRVRFRHTPMWRVRRRGLLRNAAIVLGNQRCHAAVRALIGALDDDEPLIRAASVWALRQIDDSNAWAALDRLQSRETDPLVRAELDPEFSTANEVSP